MEFTLARPVYFYLLGVTVGICMVLALLDRVKAA